MWYLTILYLYVNINTCCCITNGIKKGWLKCWVSENSACMERVPQGAVVVAEQEHVRDWSWLFQAADGAGARPGSCGILCCSCWNPGVTAQVTKSPVLLLLPPLSAGSQCLAPSAAFSSLCPLCFSLCRVCALQEHLEGAEAAAWLLPCSRECPGGAALTLCHLVKLMQCLTSAPYSSRRCLILTPPG